jgi:hypothetical protein
LFVAGTASGGAGDAGKQIAVRGHTFRWYRLRSAEPVSCALGLVGLRFCSKRLLGYHLGARLREKFVDEGCNFEAEVSNMQTKDRFGAGVLRMARASRSLCTC